MSEPKSYWELAAQILDNMSESVHLLRTEDVTFVYVNPAFERMFGYTREEVEGRHVAMLNASSDADPSETAAQILAQLEQRGVWEGELRNLRKSGEEFWSRASVTSFDDRDRGKLWLCIHSDIEAQKRQQAEREALERQLARVQRFEALGTLASGIAHDFSNVLQGMVLAVDSVLDEMAPASSARLELERAIALAERGRTLVKRILTFAQSDAPRLVVVDLREVVLLVIEMVRAILPPMIEIRPRISGGRMPVRSDVAQIEQILVNLCANAAHAMGDGGGVLTIGLRSERGEGSASAWALLSVEDTGPGIAEEHHASIFDPFYSTKPAHEGSGLGLSLVQRMVQAHGGSITFESCAGEGCRFDVRLPLLADEGAGVDASEDAQQRGRARLLFVDDELDLLEGYRSVLERRGYVVSTHANPRDALDEFRADPSAYDMLLTDQLMPGIDGMQLIRAIQALQPGLPTIMMTGSPIVAEVDAVGLRRVLHKPFRTRELLEAITSVLDSREV